MKRNTFKTKNQLLVQRFLVIILSMAVLTIVFTLISTYGQNLLLSHLNKSSAAGQDALNEFTTLTEEQRSAACKELSVSHVAGNASRKICIYDTFGDSTVITAQLDIAKQTYIAVNSLSEVDADTQLVVIRADALSAEEIGTIKTMVENQIPILFVGLPGTETLYDSSLRSLLGIQSVVGETTWPGLRVSGDLLTGTLMENAEYEISGLEVKLSKNNKVYACALPEEYQTMDNKDLPPIIWRHIQEPSGGRIYVLNGAFTENEMGYALIPVILSEINDNYIYPIINAYCVTVNGYPYASNETRELWNKLYSRDKMQIQQDLLSSQLQKYAKTYNAIITYFSPDYEIFKDTEDKELSFYMEGISATQGLLAKEIDGKLCLDDETRGVELVTVSSSLSFLDAESGTLKLPICFHSQVESITAPEYKIAGFAGTVGYYAVNIDYDDVINYSKDVDFWTNYCKEQEVMLSTQNRDYGWLERVTVREAFERLWQLLNLQIDVQYAPNQIEIQLGNFDTQAWFILRSNKNNIEINHGTVEEIGRNCYFVTITAEEAVITWEES